MADSNSKKPMALLLLVVVAVLVVIMVNQGGGFAGFDGLGKDDCAANGGVFTATGDVTTAAVDEVAATCATAAVEEVKDDPDTQEDETKAGHESVALANWDGTADEAEAKCTGDVDGHVYVYTALVPAVVEVKAEADSCSAPDYTTLATKDDCEKAHGTWTDGAAEDDGATEVDETKGSCAAWSAE